MANTKHGLQETAGVFQIKGIVTGVSKEKFFEERKTKTGKDMRMVNFGVDIAPNKSIFLNFNGMPREFAYFSTKDNDGKIVVEKVAWDKRKSFNKEGYKLIGTRIGLEKEADGKKNKKEVLTEYDACERIHEALKDDMSIFTRGKLEFSSFTNKNQEVQRTLKFIPQQLSLCGDIDFTDENFTPENGFNQQIVFMGIEKKGNEFVVSAKIITYLSIEDAEFIVRDAKLANLFKKKLKPYNAIKVSGHIEVIESVNSVDNDDDDNWGEDDPTEFVSSPTRRELVITGAKGKSIDTDTYTKAKIEEAIQKLTQSDNAQADWGESTDVKDVDDEEW